MTTTSSRDLSGTINLIRENSTSISAQLDREERQQARLIDELLEFMAKVIEKDLQHLRDTLWETEAVVIELQARGPLVGYMKIELLTSDIIRAYWQSFGLPS
ncbi:hypothetical protein HAX54_033041 [Datura stramonium]|uniref:Uncharacterized protein n=1 Tax=Datura stramonium TaxID=4076 RepID=A0ABS8VDV1_DATST|nr:hypothetical protein [Datura stramonium]